MLVVPIFENVGTKLVSFVVYQSSFISDRNLISFFFVNKVIVKVQKTCCLACLLSPFFLIFRNVPLNKGIVLLAIGSYENIILNFSLLLLVAIHLWKVATHYVCWSHRQEKSTSNFLIPAEIVDSFASQFPSISRFVQAVFFNNTSALVLH